MAWLRLSAFQSRRPASMRPNLDLAAHSWDSGAEVDGETAIGRKARQRFSQVRSGRTQLVGSSTELIGVLRLETVVAKRQGRHDPVERWLQGCISGSEP